MIKSMKTTDFIKKKYQSFFVLQKIQLKFLLKIHRK